MSDTLIAKSLGKKAGKGKLNSQEKIRAKNISKIAPDVFADEASKSHWSAKEDFDPNTDEDK